MTQKEITFEYAMRLFGKEAEKRVPGGLTREARAMYRDMCVEGLAYLAGYYLKERQ